MFILKRKRKEGRKGIRDRVRERRKGREGEGKAHFQVDSSCLTHFVSTSWKYAWSLPINFRALILLQSFTVKLKLNTCHYYKEQFSLRASATATKPYSTLWTTHDITVFRPWFLHTLFSGKLSALAFKTVLSLCQLKHCLGGILIIKKSFFVVRVDLPPHNLYSLILILHSGAV